MGNSEDTLRWYLERFLSNETESYRCFRAFLDALAEYGTHAVFFGGVLRDLMCAGPSVVPRDVDIVIAGTEGGFLQAVEGHLRRQNRFGGFHYDADGWLFDVWSLPSTWAFREGVVGGNEFEDLPRTTFLNVQAIAAEVWPQAGKTRQVFEHRFFEAIDARILDINCEENPYPHLCTVQALLSARRLGFRMSRRLANYVVHHCESDGLERLLDIQRNHYGCVYADADAMHMWWRGIKAQLASYALAPVFLPSCGHLRSRHAVDSGSF